MKLDKIKFAMLCSWISSRCGTTLDVSDMHDLDELVDFNVPNPATIKASEHDVNVLLGHLNSPSGFIPAIKAYRVLTNAGLKEAKEAVECYRNYNTCVHSENRKPETLGDILASANK